MPRTYPKDRFDDLPRRLDRVGAHRAPGKKGRRWVAFWWALSATVLLIAVGVFGLSVLNDRLNFTIPGTTSPTPAASAPTTPSAPPTAEPTVDPSLNVTVLNGTPGAGVAAAVGKTLSAAGWDVGATSNADTETVPATVVYYADPSLEGAARGVVSALSSTLPTATILLGNDFADSGAALTVVVGNDYTPPAG